MVLRQICRVCRDVSYFDIEDRIVDSWMTYGGILIVPGLCPECFIRALKKKGDDYGEEE